MLQVFFLIDAFVSNFNFNVTAFNFPLPVTEIQRLWLTNTSIFQGIKKVIKEIKV